MIGIEVQKIIVQLRTALSGLKLNTVEVCSLISEVLQADITDLPALISDLAKVSERLSNFSPEKDSSNITITNGSVLMRICDALEVKGFKKSTKIWNNNIKVWYQITIQKDPDIDQEVLVDTKNNCFKLRPKAATQFISYSITISQHLHERQYSKLSKTEAEELKLPAPTDMHRVASSVYSLIGNDPVLKLKELKQKEEDTDDIKAAMQNVKQACQGRCQVSGQVVKRIAIHHLYPKSDYPHFAANTKNLIAVSDSLHDKYHKWAHENGYGEGNYESFWKFLRQHYTSKVIHNRIDKLQLDYPELLNNFDVKSKS